MAQIVINGIAFDPVADTPKLALADLAAPAVEASDYILVQTAGPLTPEQKEQLAGLGVVIHESVSQNTYLCGFKPTDLSAVRKLPFVQWTGPYLRGFKVAARLRPQISRNIANLVAPEAVIPHRNTPQLVDVLFHNDIDSGSPELRAAIAAAAKVDADTLAIGRRKVRLTVAEKDLDALAAIDAVRVIQPVPAVGLRNNVARPILNANNVVVNGTAYSGEGQVVCVADTGFDNGTTTSPHPAFTGRVARLYALGRLGKTDDPKGHGTHVCGSVLGDGNSAAMGGAIQGTAPRATLVMQSLLDSSGSLGGIPSDLTDLFETPYRDDGARVHTNSWGSVTPSLPYDQSSREIDQFVWDNPDMVICFAAGNDGIDTDGDGVIDPAQVGSEAAAKNCITVGASESVRLEIDPDYPTYGSLRPGSFPKAPIHDDPMANHSTGMAAFSNRGPTQESRFKPDVVAPGTSILSTHSRNAGTASTAFGTSSDADYFFDTGTSMATPLVAGCAAVLRETLVKNGLANPSAALVKALLINGAVELAGQYSPTEAGPSFNHSSGFGLVNLLGSIILPGPNPDAGLGEGGPLDQGQSDSFPVDIPPRSPNAGDNAAEGVGPGATFKVTLVWSDPPGDQLQNDLDLIVIAADGTERHGNMGTGSGFDRANNVEQVVWDNMPAGPAKVVINAFHITAFPQPYAYAWRIN